MRTSSPGWLLWLPVLTLIVGLAVTGALVLVSHAQYTNNEKRLLRLRVRDAAALLAESIPSKETPLASAAELAGATNGDVQKFMRFAAPLVAAASSPRSPCGGRGRPRDRWRLRA